MSQVPLQHLKELFLDSKLQPVIRILERLVFPCSLKFLKVFASHSEIGSVLQTFGSFARLYFESNRLLWDRLKLEARASPMAFTIRVENDHGADDTKPSSANFRVCPTGITLMDVAQNLCRDFVASVPQERACHLRTNLPPAELEDLFISTPNIETLELLYVELSEGFLQLNLARWTAFKIETPPLASLLASLHLIDGRLINHNWGPLTALLYHQTSGGRAISLQMRSTGDHMCPGVAKEIRGLGGEFTFHTPRALGEMLLDRCEGDAEDGIVAVQ